MASNKTNLIARLQRWMDSVPGQTFLNYAYSWGAAIVILGTLFKLTHIPGANAMLFIGMGTEVFVFFLAGFDRPFDKNDDSELAADYDEEPGEAPVADAPAPAYTGGGAAPMPQTVIIGGGTYVPGVEQTAPLQQPAAAAAAPAGATGVSAQEVAAQAAAAQQILGTVSAANQELLNAAQATYAPEVEDAVAAYVDQLKELTDVLARVSEQATHMTQDSVEMENLNRTLTGINAIYEMQLKSVSMQVGTIDHINEQTRKLAGQIEELNGVYGRMIKALTVNMKNASAGMGE